MPSFFAELKRRNVYRVAGAYLVVSWIIMQIAEVSVPALTLPEWVNSFILLMLALGMPIALLMAWAFELTPEGIKKTADADANAASSPSAQRFTDRLIIVGLVAALGYFVWKDASPDGSEAIEKATSTARSASIAVLPFVDLSEKGDQDFFSDGISEEILNLLAKIPELDVTSRSSAFSYKGKDINIRDVGAELGVAHVLEGSVRKHGARVRITAQLIESETDKHLWSETYDGTLDDIFAVQDDISSEIVLALGEVMGFETAAQMAPTLETDQRVYEAFLLGQSLIRERRVESFTEAKTVLNEALSIDPNYAPVLGQLSLVNILEAGYTGADIVPVVESTRPLIEKAIEVAPKDPVILGIYGLFLEKDRRYDESLRTFEKALAINPSLTDVRIWYGSLLQVKGQYSERKRQIELAYQRDPLSIQAMRNYVIIKIDYREYAGLEAVFERLQRLSPEHAASHRYDMLITQMKFAQAIDSLTTALAANPDSLLLKRRLAIGLVTLGVPAAELADLFPSANDFWFQLNDMSKPEQLAAVKQRFEANPDDIQMHINYLFAQFELDPPDDLETQVDALIATIPTDIVMDTGLYFLKALVAFDKGDYSTASATAKLLQEHLYPSYAAGRRNSGEMWGLALVDFLISGGPSQSSIELFADAAVSGNIDADNTELLMSGLGWANEPGYQNAWREHQRHLARELNTVTAAYCALGARAPWQPGADRCASVN